MFDLGRIIGKKVVAIKGYKNYGDIEPSYVLFDDGETYISLEDQDYYTYHDCSTLAKEIEIHTDKGFWNKIMKFYEDANIDI